jgi:hypothetical protein
MGSWNTMEIWAPRTWRISSSLSSSRSRPLKLMTPSTILPGGSGIRRKMDMALTDLPQPDSPTMATVSPSSTS